MKRTITYFALFVLIILTFSACSIILNGKIDAFENSIAKLDSGYKEMNTEELERAIGVCEKQLEYLNDETKKFSNEQKKRIANLKGKYDKILVKIEIYLKMNDLFDVSEIDSTIQYIKGILSSE